MLKFLAKTMKKLLIYKQFKQVKPIQQPLLQPIKSIPGVGMTVANQALNFYINRNNQILIMFNFQKNFPRSKVLVWEQIIIQYLTKEVKFGLGDRIIVANQVLITLKMCHNPLKYNFNRFLYLKIIKIITIIIIIVINFLDKYVQLITKILH